MVILETAQIKQVPPARKENLRARRVIWTFGFRKGQNSSTSVVKLNGLFFIFFSVTFIVFPAFSSTQEEKTILFGQ
jgi:hypothetical protein